MRTWALLLIIAATACGPGDGYTVGGSVTPTGNVSGQLFTVSFEPIEGAAVTLSVPPGQHTPDGGVLGTTTSATGEFGFTGVPAQADLLLTMSKSGYTEHAWTTRITASAGSVPISDANVQVGPFTLSRLSGTLSFRVFTSRGYPAKGAKVYLGVLPTVGNAHPESCASFPYGCPLSRLTVTATTDDMGLVTFTNVPDPQDVMRIADYFANYTVTVPEHDENGDGVPDSGGTTQFFFASTLYLDTTPPFLQLPPANSHAPFTVLNSNVHSLLPSATAGSSARQPTENFLRPAENIYVAYGQAVAPSYAVRLTDERGLSSVPVTASLSPDKRLLVITPDVQLAAGQEYNLAIHALSLDTGAVSDVLGYFFVGSLANSTPAALQSIKFKDSTPDGQLNPGEEVTLQFNAPVGYFGSVGATRIAYFDYDIDLSGTVGDAVGEYRYPGAGFEIQPNEYLIEPGGGMVLEPSDYTTRWSLTYTGARSIPATTPVSIELSRLLDPLSGVQTIWGQPVTENLTVNLSR